MSRTTTVAVIGGGLAGLFAAGLLARNGIRVRLFEANDRLGGCCASTKLAGYTLDDGALYLVLPGILDHAFRRLGLDRASILPLRKISAVQTTRLPGNTVVTMGEGLELSVTRDDRVVATPELRRELETFLRKWTPVLRLFADDIIVHPPALLRLLAKGWPHLLKFRGTVAAELNRSFADDAVRAALAGVLLYVGLPAEKVPAVSVLAIAAMLEEGLFLPEGGMGRLPEVLGQFCRASGCEIALNSRATRLVTQRGRIHALEIAGQGLIEADAVISTVSGMATYSSLLDLAELPGSIRRKVRKAPLSHTTFCVQLGLANVIGAPSYSNSVLPLMRDQWQFFDPQTADVQWLNFTVPTVTMPELAPPNGSIVQLFVPIDQKHPADVWDDVRTERLCESAIKRLSSLYPLEIAVKRVMSPKYYQDRMHLYRGAIYGLSPAANPMAQFPHRSPIRGLYLAGQTTYPGYGVGSAALSGLFAADALMEAEVR